MFYEYRSKPITRKAHRLTDADTVVYDSNHPGKVTGTISKDH